MRAVFVCPASGVPPEPCPCAEDTDGAARDVQAADLGVDAVTKDWPFEDRPDVVAVDDAVDVQLVDVGTDSGPADAGSDRPDGVADVPRDAGPVDGGPVCPSD